MIRIEGIRIVKARLSPRIRVMPPRVEGRREALPRAVKPTDPGVESDQMTAAAAVRIAV